MIQLDRVERQHPWIWALEDYRERSRTGREVIDEEHDWYIVLTNVGPGSAHNVQCTPRPAVTGAAWEHGEMEIEVLEGNGAYIVSTLSRRRQVLVDKSVR
jgi:hypothetical protein